MRLPRCSKIGFVLPVIPSQRCGTRQSRASNLALGIQAARLDVSLASTCSHATTVATQPTSMVVKVVSWRRHGSFWLPMAPLGSPASRINTALISKHAIVRCHQAQAPIQTRGTLAMSVRHSAHTLVAHAPGIDAFSTRKDPTLFPMASASTSLGNLK